METFIFTIIVGLVVVVGILFISMVFDDFGGCLFLIICIFLCWLIGKITLFFIGLS